MRTRLFRIGTPGAFVVALGALATPSIYSIEASAKPVTIGAPRSFGSNPAPGTRARCAVSGEEFTVSARTQSSVHNGRVYVFCCPDCKPDFDQNPTKFEDKSVKK